MSIDDVMKRKSVVVTVRLTPKLKYIAKLAARRQRRTLSGYIKWAIARQNPDGKFGGSGSR